MKKLGLKAPLKPAQRKMMKQCARKAMGKWKKCHFGCKKALNLKTPAWKLNKKQIGAIKYCTLGCVSKQAKSKQMEELEDFMQI